MLATASLASTNTDEPTSCQQQPAPAFQHPTMDTSKLTFTRRQSLRNLVRHTDVSAYAKYQYNVVVGGSSVPAASVGASASSAPIAAGNDSTSTGDVAASHNSSGPIFTAGVPAAATTVPAISHPPATTNVSLGKMDLLWWKKTLFLKPGPRGNWKKIGWVQRLPKDYLMINKLSWHNIMLQRTEYAKIQNALVRAGLQSSPRILERPKPTIEEPPSKRSKPSGDDVPSGPADTVGLATQDGVPPHTPADSVVQEGPTTTTDDPHGSAEGTPINAGDPPHEFPSLSPKETTIPVSAGGSHESAGGDLGVAPAVVSVEVPIIIPTAVQINYVDIPSSPPTPNVASSAPQEVHIPDVEPSSTPSKKRSIAKKRVSSRQLDLEAEDSSFLQEYLDDDSTDEEPVLESAEISFTSSFCPDTYTTCSSFSIEPSIICDQGSSHTQQFNCLSAPYERWISTPEKGIDNNKQGFLRHEGRHVCLKCQNADSTNSVNGRGKAVCSEAINDEREPVYSTPENTSNSPNIQCAPMACENLVNICGPQSENRPVSRIRNPTQRRRRQRAQNENTSSSNSQRMTEDGFPNHYFDFVAYNQLPYKVIDSNDPTQTEYPVLTDYIGCYMRSTDKQKWGNPNRNQMINRKIEIQNLNRASIELTLWDDLAKSFKKDEIDALEKPVLIAVSSCRVTRYRNTFQLQSTPATYYYINPKIPELEQYLQEYRSLFDINPPLQIVRHPYEDKEQERMRNRILLDVLLKESPQNHIGVRFTCDGVITSINTLREWYYPSCTKCNIKAEIHEGRFDCKAHGVIESPNYKYNFKAYITDGSATAMITFFTPKADDFIGVNCNSLVRSLTNPDPRKIPPEVNSIVGKRHIFQFHFNTNSKQKPPDFVFNQILDTPGLPHQIGSTASGSDPVEKTCPTIQYPTTSTVVPYLHTEEESPTQETRDEGTPIPETEAQIHTSAATRPMQTEQLPEVQQLTPMHDHPTKDDTPTATPSTPHTGMQTRSKTDEANRRAIKRPLFPEESPDNKKKKS
ncbi:hypothetical protein CTI12_AA119640 [Artemisia annua]|uniref:Replication factor A C-terminal domain-containing protein n=1 Tax=Artemisia annua TaxID=35608 RepID=A0A2U1PS22_ARTAN|nr:hypothetical protein CTI12_AA119640 [Artemisia annua]